MEPTQEQRFELARRIEDLRIEHYGGNRRAAYNAAGVNAATWTKAENGERLAERSLNAIVKLLWPETGGDWRKITPPLAKASLESRILDGPFDDEEKDYLVRLVKADRRVGRQKRGVS